MINMKSQIEQGDVVKSIAGRDKGEYLLVLKVFDGVALLVNGKTRKTDKPKLKNIKHIEKVITAESKDFAEKIIRGETVSNRKVNRYVKSLVQKNKED